MTAPSENPYLAGNPVYRGGSSMPTAGTVDPLGYIARGINQQSQKRSGLAAAALQRLRNNTNGDTPQVPGQSPETQAPTQPVTTGTLIDFVISPTGQLVPNIPPPDPMMGGGMDGGMGSGMPDSGGMGGNLMAAAQQRLGGM